MEWWLIAGVAVVALLYSSVGHGGASGYLAILSLVPGALMPEEMSTTALMLNLAVSAVAWLAFMSEGYFSFSLTAPFIVLSVPAAFLGGTLAIPVEAYAFLLAFCLLFASWHLVAHLKADLNAPTERPPLYFSLPSGGAIGLLSGIVGVGGGIFLSPVMILKRWATPKQVAATSAFFILVNSAAGLAGRLAEGSARLGDFLPLLVAAFLGGLAGSAIGSKRATPAALRVVLAVVIALAAVKLIKVGLS